MNQEQKMVEAFHREHGIPIRDTPTMPDAEQRLFRARLIVEEAAEFMAASSRRDMVEMADALCDLLYVVYGTAVVMGLDLEPILAEIQRSNMTKCPPSPDAFGKAVKGPDYVSPDIAARLREQGWSAGT